MNTTTAPSPSFLDELRDCGRRLPDKGYFLALLAGWIALFQMFGVSTRSMNTGPSLLEWLWAYYGLPALDAEYAKLIPFAIVAILWHKRAHLLGQISETRWPSLILLGSALVLHVAGFAAQQPSLSALGFFLGLYSLVGLTWGAQAVKESLFPFFLLGFCLPFGSVLTDITFWPRLFATDVTYIVSHDLLGVPLVQHGTTLTKPDGSAFEVAAACSGMRSFSALLVVTTIFAMMALQRFWKRALLILVTVPLAAACNVMRLVVMVIADRAFGARAGELTHDSDWIFTYGVAIITIMALGRWLRRHEVSPAT